MRHEYIKELLDIDSIELKSLIEALSNMRNDNVTEVKPKKQPLWVPASKPLVYRNSRRRARYRAYRENKVGEEELLGETTTLKAAVALQMKYLEKKK